MTRLRQSRGFSLIELMIGVALGLVVLASLTTFFVSSSATRNEIERTSRQIENGRYAVESLREEIHLAGFYAELITSGATWTSPDPCVSAAVADMGFALGPPLNVPLPIFGYPEDTAKPACITDQVKGTDVLVIHRFNTEPVTVAAAAVDGQNYFWQPSRCRNDSTTTPWVFNTGASGGFGLRTLACAAPANLYKMHVTVFYVRNYSFSPGDKTPTLVKLEVDRGNPNADGNGIVASQIAEGIRSLRLEYGIDNDGNGSPDQWSRCEAAAPCTPAQWSNVMAVRVHVLAENQEDTIGYVDKKVYDMGTGLTELGPFGDAKKRHVYAAVVSSPNRTGPREQGG
jgi:type IV pilus assembly protein PilW